ncbi:transporter substrate-binding domain-containing protein [Clostridium tagluense]|uniref:transporter substrate-binding domain-containing protein n=1 Tax=Clostridium tagluense TaxID=360422 RepID=UPI001C0DC462|nr:transporter substrate-binding domain-containing protein [Clostridium tagluense]MBU3128986.1 transporter substrate-binding domain-containing protein [Clostridium tagluense]
MIKKLLIITISILAIISLIVIYQFKSANLLPRENKHIVLKVAGDINFPPYEYADENGIYTGFNVDIMRAIALSTGIDIKFYPMSWKEACEKLKNGEVDVIEGMKIETDRDKYYEFSKEYLENSQSIFVVEGNNDINQFRDLENKKVVIQQGDVSANNLNTLNNVNIVYTNDQEQAINKLLTGEADAYIGNTLTGVFFINKLDIKNKIKIVGKVLNPTKYSVAVKYGNVETLRIINSGLKEIKKNGTYDKIYRKWFGQPVNLPNWYIKRIIFFSAIVIPILAIIMLLFYKWNNRLKKEVNKQTREINNANDILVKKNIQIKLERDFREQILNNIFSGIVTINKQGEITFTNKLAEIILKSELIGKQYVNTSISEIINFTGFVKSSGEKEFLIASKKLYINYKVDILSNVDEDMDEMIVIFRDITEEKLMQENIRTKDKMQSLGNLISGIAHEIRNPLTSIRAYVELIPKKFDNPKFREMVSKDIPTEIDRLNSLINDLLEYSKPQKPYKERTDLCEIVNKVILLLKNKLQTENIIIENNINKNIFVFIDKNQFRQVLINIALNAVECLDKQDKRIIIWSKVKSNSVLLYIKDNGCGIQEETINKIFNPFFTTKDTGTGLGLFISYQLLSENNATIEVQSDIDQGTTFIIEFCHMEADN